jgi:hypothetical protein
MHASNRRTIFILVLVIYTTSIMASSIEKQKYRLVKAEKGISYYGNFRFLGYNPPYQFIGRRNEIIMSVNYTEDDHHN